MASVKMTRIDYRMIHGQVVAKWIKVCPIKRIVLVDDVLGADDFMSSIYKTAVPHSIEVDIIKEAEVQETLDATGDTVLLIFKDIESTYRAFQANVEFGTLIVGAVPNAADRRLITSGVALSEKELSLLEEIEKGGGDVKIQPIPESAAISLENARKKIK